MGGEEVGVRFCRVGVIGLFIFRVRLVFWCSEDSVILFFLVFNRGMGVGKYFFKKNNSVNIMINGKWVIWMREW